MCLGTQKYIAQVKLPQLTSFSYNTLSPGTQTQTLYPDFYNYWPLIDLPLIMSLPCSKDDGCVLYADDANDVQEDEDVQECEQDEDVLEG